jgi:hypothetical protein
MRRLPESADHGGQPFTLATHLLTRSISPRTAARIGLARGFLRIGVLAGRAETAAIARRNQSRAPSATNYCGEEEDPPGLSTEEIACPSATG